MVALSLATGWTRGGDLAGNLTKTQELIAGLPGRVQALSQAGVTRQMAQQWANIYRNVCSFSGSVLSCWHFFRRRLVSGSCSAWSTAPLASAALAGLGASGVAGGVPRPRRWGTAPLARGLQASHALVGRKHPGGGAALHVPEAIEGDGW